MAVEAVCARLSKSSRHRLVGGALVVSLFWIGSLALKPADNLRWRLRSRAERVKLDGKTTSGLYSWPSHAWTIGRLRQLVEEHVPPKEAIFVGEHRHDVLVTGKSYLYFALDRPVVGRFFELHPGVVDTAPAQREIISELEQRQTPLIILGRSVENDVLDRLLETHRKNLPAVGATDLDDYIGQHYDLLERVDPFQVLLRRSSTGVSKTPSSRGTE